MKINEIFYSIQGEGTQAGFPTVFLRLFACDLRCTWCDTMYAVEGRDFKDMEIQEILAEIYKYKCKRLCITGGEPLIQYFEVEKLSHKLSEDGFFIVLETSGHKKPPDIFQKDNFLISMDCKCPSSGMHKKMEFSLYEQLNKKDQLKFVIADKEDYEYARMILNKYSIKASIIFQPVYGENIEWLANAVLKDNLGNIRIIPQIHKVIWGNKRGV
ncbi:MAG: 7-carboxy-7-deazaguanine synthase QueE [Thermodesulfobacteriota bacterium]